MYTLKSKPEDFIVTEVLDLQILSEPCKFAVFTLKKTSLNTIQVIDMITKHFGLRPNDVGFAGIKDRHAITSQYISLPLIEQKVTVEKVAALSIPNVEITHVGYSHKAIYTPMIAGNKFTITIRDHSEYEFKELSEMINYFGEQRFSKNNADIGHAFVKKDFKRAVELILAYTSDKSKLTYNERKVSEYLEKNPTDYVGALRRLPGKTTKFFLHAYQSKLWNETVSKLVLAKCSEGFSDDSIFAFIPSQIPSPIDEKVPAVGFFYDEEDWSEDIQEAIDSLFERDNITERDFVIKQMSEVTEMGAIRNTIVPIKDLTVDEHTEDKLVLTFTLERGCYATMALRHLLVKK